MKICTSTRLLGIVSALASFPAVIVADEGSFQDVEDTCSNDKLRHAASYAANFFCTEKLIKAVPDFDCSAIGFEVIRARQQGAGDEVVFESTIALTNDDHKCVIGFGATIDWFGGIPKVANVSIKKCGQIDYVGDCNQEIEIASKLAEPLEEETSEFNGETTEEKEEEEEEEEEEIVEDVEEEEEEIEEEKVEEQEQEIEQKEEGSENKDGASLENASDNGEEEKPVVDSNSEENSMWGETPEAKQENEENNDGADENQENNAGDSNTQENSMWGEIPQVEHDSSPEAPTESHNDADQSMFGEPSVPEVPAPDAGQGMFGEQAVPAPDNSAPAEDAGQDMFGEQSVPEVPAPVDNAPIEDAGQDMFGEQSAPEVRAPEEPQSETQETSVEFPAEPVTPQEDTPASSQDNSTSSTPEGTNVAGNSQDQMQETIVNESQGEALIDVDDGEEQGGSVNNEQEESPNSEQEQSPNNEQEQSSNSEQEQSSNNEQEESPNSEQEQSTNNEQEQSSNSDQEESPNSEGGENFNESSESTEQVEETVEFAEEEIKEEEEELEQEEDMAKELEEDESTWNFKGSIDECSRFGVSPAEGIVFLCDETAYVCGFSLQFRERFLLLTQDPVVDGCEFGKVSAIASSREECNSFPTNEHHLKRDGRQEEQIVQCPNGAPLSSYYMFCSQELDNYYCDGAVCDTCEAVSRKFLRH